MAEPLVFRRPAAKAPTIHPELSHGDVLYRLSLIAPEIYKALETLARSQYHACWPLEEDVIAVLSRR
jgi:hypothetical protein